MATGIVSTLRYWLVGHPKIAEFSWIQGQTLGASPLFLTSTVFLYLSLTLILSRLPLPTINPNLFQPIKVIHSTFLLLLSAVMVVGCVVSAAASHSAIDGIFCYPPGTRPAGPAFFWAYVFYLSKLVEFGDTLLIILGEAAGKQRRRLSFLHVFHHCMAVFMCYNALRTAQSLFPAVMAVNASVHVVMYGYYALCAVGLRPAWKRLVTDCQIAQFKISFLGVVAVIYFHFSGEGCSGTWSWCFNILFNSALLVLFIDFRRKNYGDGDYYVNKKE
ncbi:Putative elongation of fatty acids protein [Morus notabilis]|uniref:very-long-chain 3-oxoacyl-CoA synthase n=1 Tax=Morus notabilis TaxID=981085 RepID=W9SF59_9ROSA|nr:elongation of fatty acids protein 3-like [Morus notabilis]EXC65267.1 Putative elongation of fatty acids protein [Morus notabilis]